MWVTFAAVVSALVAVVGLFVSWRKTREASLRREDVLSWSNDVIRALTSLWLICKMTDHQLDSETAKQKILETIFETSILVERGRLFFKNKVIDDYGRDKKPAYRGYRPLILDPIILAHDIACEWPQADRKTRLRMHVLAEDCLKTFVSLAQLEVGRSRTASAITGKGGTGVRLFHLLQQVDDDQLARIQTT